MRPDWLKYTVGAFGILVLALFTIVAVVELLIGSGVRTYSQKAQANFHGKRVEALIAMVECESCYLQDRNDAVWALGQLDDPRALPVLEKYSVGGKGYQPNSLSQDRLRIALRHLRHEDSNRFESVLWRWMLPVEN
jgi:hypothetical protein